MDGEAMAPGPETAGGRPVLVTLNLSAARFYLTMALVVVSLGTAVWGAASTVAKMQIESTLRPVVRECVREEVGRQLSEQRRETDRALGEIRERLGAIQAASERNTKLLSRLLDQELARRRGGE